MDGWVAWKNQNYGAQLSYVAAGLVLTLSVKASILRLGADSLVLLCASTLDKRLAMC